METRAPGVRRDRKSASVCCAAARFWRAPARIPRAASAVGDRDARLAAGAARGFAGAADEPAGEAAREAAREAIIC